MAEEDDEIVRAIAARKGSPFLSSQQAAAYLKCSERKMRRMRTACTGPRYRLHGGRIQYHVDDLIFWSRSTAHGNADGAPGGAGAGSGPPSGPDGETGR